MVIVDTNGASTVQIVSYPSNLAQARCPQRLTIALTILFLCLGCREAKAAQADSPEEIVLGMSTVFDWSASAGFGDLEGYIAARILTLALEKIQGSPTREAVIDALEGLGKFDIGLGETLYLSRTEHQASHRVWPTILRGGRFEPFQWSDITALSKGEAPP
jgi:hypothetical protein